MPAPVDITPRTDGEALLTGAIGGASVALPAAALLVLAKAYRQERRRMDMANSKDSDTLVITLPEKRGSPLSDVGDKAKAVGSELVDKTEAAVGSVADKLRGAKDAVGHVFSVDNAGNALQSLIRSGFRGAGGSNDGSEGLVHSIARNAGEVARTFAGETSNAAKLPEASRQALKYLAAVITGGVILRGADALYEAYNQRKLRRLEEASRKEYINRLFAKDAQVEPQTTEQDGQLVGGVMAYLALLAGTSAYGTKKVLDAMYPKTYAKVKAPVVRRIEFRSLPRDAQKADSAEEYEEFQDAQPALKVAALLEDGSECDLPWDVVRVLGIRHALLQDASENAFRKFASHATVLDWCAERFITVDQLREKLAQSAQEATPQQQAEFYRLVDDVMKNPDMSSKLDEISQSAVLSGRAATPWGSPSLLVSNDSATAKTRAAVTAQMRHRMADSLAKSFGLAMPGFQAASNGSTSDSWALDKNIEAAALKREPELRSLAYRAAAGNKNLAAVLAKNVRETTAYKNMSPTLRKVMDWLGTREAGSLPRMLYDWIIKRQVTSALSTAEENYVNTQASIFANAPPAKPEEAAATTSAAAQPRPAGARRKGQPGAADPAQPTTATYGRPGGLGGMPAFVGRSDELSPMLLGAMTAATPVEPGSASPATKPIASSPGLTLNPRQSYARIMAAGAGTPAAAPAPTTPAPASAPAPATRPEATNSGGPTPQTSVSSGARGASNVLNGKPFFDFLPKGKGFEHAASANISPASLAEKLLTARKRDAGDDDDEAMDASRKLPQLKRRHIDVEATDPRAEEFVRKNKSRLVAALSNAVNAGDL